MSPLLREFWNNVKAAIRGRRACHYCGRWTQEPHEFKRRCFCDRICSARWAKALVDDVERRAREAGA